MRVKNSTTICQAAGVILAGLILAACNTASNGNKTSPEDALGLNQQTGDTETETLDNTNNLRAFCPRTIIRDGTETYREFDTATTNGAQTVSFQSTITQVVRECNYSQSNLNIRVGVKGRAINGPSGKTGIFNVPVRVAVVDGSKDVKYSMLHQVPVTIPPNGTNALFSYIDGNINLPVPDGPNLIVFVGFDEGPPGE